MGLTPNFKEIQQDMTELNGDGNRQRGHYGEDKSPPKQPPIFEEEDDGQPTLYEEYQDVFGGDDQRDPGDENPSW